VCQIRYVYCAAPNGLSPTDGSSLQLNILITNPFCWPYVRRGSERFLHELSQFLARRGHQVTALTSKPGPEETVWEGSVQVIRKRQRDSRWLRRLRLSPDRTFAASVFRFVQQNRYDAIVCLHFWDAFGAAAAQRFRAQPLVYHLTGIPWGPYFRRKPVEEVVFRSVLRTAASIVARTPVFRFWACRNSAPDPV
jgi:phosphatidyl-myo-inositol alpha-mannosyltransferase